MFNASKATVCASARWLALTCMVTSLSACLSEEDIDEGSSGEEATAAQQSLYLGPNVALWPVSSDGIHYVPVCFADKGGYTTSQWNKMRARFEQVVAASWGLWTNLEFIGFDTCPTTDPVGTIRVDMVHDSTLPLIGTGPSGGSGSSDVGYFDWSYTGITFWFDGATAQAQNLTIIHEVGHAIGFPHEQDRPDAIYSDGEYFCMDGPSPLEGGTYLSEYDDVSVMNYCNANDFDGLSRSDMTGAQTKYGTPQEERWLLALPAIALQSL